MERTVPENLPLPTSTSAAVGGYLEDYKRTVRENNLSLLIKCLLITSVVEAPASVEAYNIQRNKAFLIWYTLHALLSTTGHHLAFNGHHRARVGLRPSWRSLYLLAGNWYCNVMLAATASILFLRDCDTGTYLLFMVDSTLTGIDVLIHVANFVRYEMKENYWERKNALEMLVAEEEANDDNGPSRLEVNMEELDTEHVRMVSLIESTIFVFSMMGAALLSGQFIYIWVLNGMDTILMHGILVMNLQSTASHAWKKIKERRNLNRIGHSMNALFQKATKSELGKATANGGVCSVCLCTMSIVNVRKIGCGHFFHVMCLREVVERAGGVEAAKCPLCRSNIIDGKQEPKATGVIDLTGASSDEEGSDGESVTSENSDESQAEDSVNEESQHEDEVEQLMPSTHL